MPAVHREHDAGGEDLPVAVHRVQVLQPLRNLRERRMYHRERSCSVLSGSRNVIVHFELAWPAKADMFPF